MGDADSKPNNSGKQGVYAGGWRVGDDKHFYYLGGPGCDSQDSLCVYINNIKYKISIFLYPPSSA